MFGRHDDTSSRGLLPAVRKRRAGVRQATLTAEPTDPRRACSCAMGWRWEHPFPRTGRVLSRAGHRIVNRPAPNQATASRRTTDWRIIARNAPRSHSPGRHRHRVRRQRHALRAIAARARFISGQNHRASRALGRAGSAPDVPGAPRRRRRLAWSDLRRSLEPRAPARAVADRSAAVRRAAGRHPVGQQRRAWASCARGDVRRCALCSDRAGLLPARQGVHDAEGLVAGAPAGARVCG